MTKKKRDLVVLTAGIAASLIFLSALYFDINRQGVAGSKVPVGTLVSKKRVAQRRSADRVVWTPINREERLYNLDAVRTDAGSSALLRLDDNTEILLEENSLVILDFSETKKTIEFLEGSVIARRGSSSPKEAGTKAGAAQIVIKADKSEISLAAGTLDIKRSVDKTLAVGVSGGSATVRDKDGTNTITETQSVSIGSGETKVREVLLVPLAPTAGSIAFGDGPRVNVSFTWSSADAKPPYLVEVSDSRDFLITQTARSQGKSASMPLAAGDYFWRLGDSAGLLSKAQPFSVVADIAPEALAPANGAEFGFRNEAPAMRLTWKTAAGVSAYEYELAEDKEFLAVTLRGTTSNASAQMPPLAEKTYFWRVRARYDHSGITAGKYSETRSFILKKQAEMVSPAIALPEDGSKIDLAAALAGGTVFAWNASPDAKSYELSVFAGADPRKIVATWSGSSTFAKPVLQVDAGEYRWTVRAMAADGTSSKPSAARAFTVTKRIAPVAVSPSDELELEQRAPALVGFGWTGTGEVKLSVYSDSAMKNEVTGTSTTASRASLSIPSYGTYFWTVSSPDGSSPPRTLTLTKPLGSPTLLQPAQAFQLEVVSVSGVSFQWSAVEGASGYRFALWKAGEDKPVAEQVLAKTGCEIPAGLVSSGEYSWSVQALQEAKGKTPKSGQASFASFGVSMVRITQAPKITLPKEGSLIDGLSALRGGIKISWRASEPKASYSVRLESAEKPGHAILEKRTSEVSVTFPTPGAGSYSVSIEGEAFDGVLLPVPKAQFRVGAVQALPTPEITHPSGGSRNDMTNADSFTFSWMPVSGATAYEISLSQKQGSRRIFSRIVEKAASYVFRELENLDVGEFIFTVKALSLAADGSLERSSLETSKEFSMVLSPKAAISPALVSPKELYVPPKP